MFTILSIADSDKHFSSAISEYEKRLWKALKIENLKPLKESNIDLIIKKETESLIDTIEKKYADRNKILLIKEGEKLDTISISSFLQGQNTIFIIWGPYGVDALLLKKAFPQLKQRSFWAITLPHGLAKLTLIEQLYRCTTLWTGKKYHY